MMGFYDTYGKGAQDKLPETFNPDHILRDIEYAKKDISVIQMFIQKAREQLEVIAAAKFITEVSIERRSYNKVEYYVSSGMVPQVPGGQRLKIYPHDDSKRFTGKERKAAITYAQELSAKHGNCAIVGNFAEHIPKPKGVIVL